MKKNAKNPYAIGMSIAKKLKKDEPPLEKSTIIRAHDIAKGIMKTEKKPKKSKKKVSEKWEGKAEIKSTGEYAGKTLAQLNSMLDKLKKSGPHKAGSAENKKMKQLMFAIRAKKNWKGGVKKESVEQLDETGAKLRKYIPGLGKLQAANRASSREHAANLVRSVVPNPDQDSLVKKYDKNARRYRKLVANESQLNELSPEKYGQVATAAKNRIIDLERALEQAKKIGDTESAQRYADAIEHYKGLEGEASTKKTTGMRQRKLGIAKSRGSRLLPARLRQNITTEADRPLDGDQLGPGSHSGRGNVLESKTKKRINETMNTCEAAYHEGKSHGLSKHAYACRYNEGTEEHRRYHKGYIEGLDECYGLQPNRGLVDETVDDMVETASYMDDNDLPEITDDELVDDMASYGAHDDDMLDEMHTELDEVSRGEWIRQKDREAERAGKGSFNAFGQTFNTADIDEAFTFESLERQLNALLKEDAGVTEGLSVSMSKGLEGVHGQSGDSVSVTATDDDASKLLGFIKQVGLGGLGDEKSGDQPAAAIVSVSDYGAPAFNGHDDMKNMMTKMSADDYEEESEESEHHHHQPEVCTECGMNETKCQCDEEVVETETEDQETEQVAEDDGEGYTSSQSDAGKIDSALALSGASKGGAVNEGGDGMEDSPESAGAVAAADADEEEEEAMSESSFASLYKKLSLLSEESTAEKDDKAEKAGRKVVKDIENKEKKDKKQKVDEWANEAGKDGTEASFQRDIDFMTKVISGGLNKPKSTGQQTVPVLAQDEKRTVDHVDDWMKLAGIKK